jgi:flagellar biosynthesis protein FlhG
VKPLAEQDHYEILEVARSASQETIEQSYRLSQGTYSEDSLAGYSMFGGDDATAIRERIDVAYAVLSDAAERRTYDASLGAPKAAEPPWDPQQQATRPADLAESTPPGEAPTPLPVNEFEALEDEDLDYDGAHLRRSRLQRGIELEEISGVTKINPTYLRFIEECRYAELPAPVYVRGFVAAYAECMGLDSKQVARSYMNKYEAAMGESQRGRLLRDD